MNNMLKWQHQLVPEAAHLLRRRYTILRQILAHGTVGRRTLAHVMGMTERVLRSEVELLQTQGLIMIDSAGMKINALGERLLTEMEPYISELFGLSELEERLREAFSLQAVVIVAGDSDESALVKQELGRAGASILRKLVTNDEVIAVTGGSTMAEVASGLTESPNFKGCCFVPARGGLGESVELQANTIASTMAKKTGCPYRLLHVPDHLREEAYQTLIREPNVKEILTVIRQARIVIHGIGDAMAMARRRKMDEMTQRQLEREGALAEAFGYYFNQQGQVVHYMPTVGLRLDDLEKMELVIAVAGGKSKGKSIASVLRFGQENVLVTDEAAAIEVLQELSS